MNRNTARRQRGAALVISLVVLLLLTIIAVTAASSSSLELMIATNNQNAADALAQAEDSVLAGEQLIRNNHATGGPAFNFDDDDTDGLYTDGAVDPENVDWSAIATEQAFVGGVLATEFVIEYLGTAASQGGSMSTGTGGGAGTRHIYRISGRGASSRGTVRLVQTIFATQ